MYKAKGGSCVGGNFHTNQFIAVRAWVDHLPLPILVLLPAGWDKYLNIIVYML